MGRIRALLRAGGTVLVAIVAGALFSTAAEAAPGDLDTTFSTDGTQRTDFLTGESQAAAVVRQPDGKIVAVGLNFAQGPFDFAIARYNPDGSPDTSFSADGRQVTDFAGTAGNDGAFGVALQSDGKIVAVGTTAIVVPPPATSRSPAITQTARSTRASPETVSRRRTWAESSPETAPMGWRSRQTARSSLLASLARPVTRVPTTLGSSVTTRTARSTPPSPETASRGPTSVSKATRQGGWQSRATARSSPLAAQGSRVARYNPNGSLDTTFSGDGKQVTDFGGFGNANAVALDSDGRIVAAGSGSGGTVATSPSPATTSTARWTRASPATASRRPTSGVGRGDMEWRSRRTERSSRLAPPVRCDPPFTATSRSPATTRMAPSTRHFPGTASRPPTSGASAGASARGQPEWWPRRTERSSRWGRPMSPASAEFALARYNPTARSTQASRATASRRPTSGASTTPAAWRSSPMARSSRSALPSSA